MCFRISNFFCGRRPFAFRRVALETPEWTSRDSNHHRQSVSAGKTNAIPTEPSGRLSASGISKADPRHSNQEVRLHELYEHSSVTTQSKWMPWWLIPPGSSSPMQWYAHKFGSTQNLKRLLKPLASLPQASQTNDSVDPFHKFLVQDRRSSKLPCPGRRPPQVQRKPWRSQRSSCPRHSDSIQAPQTTFAPQVQCLLQALTWLPL